MISRNALHWIWLQQALGYNNPKPAALQRLGYDIRSFYSESRAEWSRSGIFSIYDIKKMREATLEKAEAILESCEKNGYSVITLEDPKYPQRLRQLYAPPAVIYVRGDVSALDPEITVGVVGTRTASEGGVKKSYQFGYALSKSGIVTVSGGALGIDCACHRGALAAGGEGICVLGCGLSFPYLNSNSGMREGIAKSGALVSEYAPDEPPKKHYFPARNRLIAAFSDSLVIVEAQKGSGSLITAKFAFELKKEVMVVYSGRNHSILDDFEWLDNGNVKVIDDFMDVLASLEKRSQNNTSVDFDSISLADIKRVPVKEPPRTENKPTVKKAAKEKTKAAEPEKPTVKAEAESVTVEKTVADEIKADAPKPAPEAETELTKEQKAVFECIGQDPVLIDSIVFESKLPVHLVLRSVTVLEMMGLVKALPGRYYQSIK